DQAEHQLDHRPRRTKSAKSHTFACGTASAYRIGLRARGRLMRRCSGLMWRCFRSDSSARRLVACGRSKGGHRAMETRRALIGVGLGLYLTGFGMLAGVALERMRFDHKR